VIRVNVKLEVLMIAPKGAVKVITISAIKVAINLYKGHNKGRTSFALTFMVI
jgi:hypothetical protein